MNIVLVSFQGNTDIIGVKYLHAFLKEAGHNCNIILQPNSKLETDDLVLDFVFKNNIELVGLSIMTDEFIRAAYFSKRFKEVFPHVPLIFGGIHATAAPLECLNSGADAVVLGEGERALLELVEYLEEGKDYSELESICSIRDSVLKINPVRMREENLDLFPFPDHHPDNMYVVDNNRLSYMNQELFQKYSTFQFDSGLYLNIVTSRGCPFSCSYCCNSIYQKLYSRKTITRRSPENVIEECNTQIKRHPYLKIINMQDDCFLLHSVEWIRRFSAEYKNRIGLPFYVRVIPTLVTKEKLDPLVDAGLRVIIMGLQSGSDKINKEIYNRNVKAEDFLRAAHLINQYNINANYDIILDNPYETEEDVMRTLRVTLSIPKPFSLNLYSLCFYPGSKLYDMAIRDNLNFLDPKLSNYRQIRHTSLNLLISMVPSYPNSLIKFLLRFRNLFVIKILNLINTFILKRYCHLKRLHILYGSSIPKTLAILKYGFYTKRKRTVK